MAWRSRDAPGRRWGIPALISMLVAVVPVPLRGQDSPVDTATAVIAVVRGLRNDRGHVRGGLYGSAQTFTRSGEEVATCAARIAGGIARCRFEGLAPGRYALGVMHDEDDDGRFDQGFMGIPEEGYAFSRDARGPLGAPSFESAAFDFDGRRSRTLTLRMRYGI